MERIILPSYIQLEDVLICSCNSHGYLPRGVSAIYIDVA